MRMSNIGILAVFVFGLWGPPATTRADDLAVPEGLASSDWSSIRNAYQAGRHAAFADVAMPGHYGARNPGQQWITRFDGRGFITTPNAGGWTWGLELKSYGRGDTQRTITGTACVEAKGSRVEYEWNGALTEWYINDQRGFEHGYTLHTRPDTSAASRGLGGSNSTDDGMLQFTLAVRGDLLPRVNENGRDVAFIAPSGDVAVNYNGLKVFDADGVHLAASFRAVTAAPRSPQLLLTIDDTHARYPLTIDPTAQQAYLKASNTGNSDAFGWAVAASGDTVVVGALAEDSNSAGVNGNEADNSIAEAGAAYVFVRSGTTWTQQAYLKASNPGPNDQFGNAVAISGDTIVVGAYAESSNATGVNGNEADNSAVSSGAAYVFVRPSGGSTWTQQAYLKASNTGANDLFGWSVAVSNNTVVVGAYGERSTSVGVNGNEANNDASKAGAAYIFERSGTTWTQQAYLKASNTGANDEFGQSVGVSGDTVVVGAWLEDSNAAGVNGNEADNSAAQTGAAYIFERSGTTWTQQAYLKASNSGAGDAFGESVAVSGDTIVVSAIGEASNATGVNGNQADNSAAGAGAVYVFVRPSGGTTWTQQAYLKASNPGVGDDLGTSLALSDDTVVAGTFREDSIATGVNGNGADNSAMDSGAAYVFLRTGTTWTQQAYLKASNTGANDRFGWSVAVSGETVVVGAYQEDSNATGVNGDQANNSAFNPGAAYIFAVGLPTPTSPFASPDAVCGGEPASLSVADPGPGIVIDWFAFSCGSLLIGTGNPFEVAPATTTTYFARARRTSDGHTSDACASVTVTVTNCRCNPADIAFDDGTPLPPIGTPGGTNNGVTEGDYNQFFATFFDAVLTCDIANDDGSPLPPFGTLQTNNGVTEGDYNLFFSIYFDGCGF